MVWSARDIFRVAGVVVFTTGFLCLPVGIGANPKRDTSVFFNYADMGAFLQIAVALIPAGVLIFLIAFLFPDDG